MYEIKNTFQFLREKVQEKQANDDCDGITIVVFLWKKKKIVRAI